MLLLSTAVSPSNFHWKIFVPDGQFGLSISQKRIKSKPAVIPDRGEFQKGTDLSTVLLHCAQVTWTDRIQLVLHKEQLSLAMKKL